MAEDPSTAMLFVRLALSLGVVLALVGAATWLLRRRGLLRPVGGQGASGRLEVLDRKPLGKQSSLVLARVGGHAVLLGVTGERIEVLSDAPGLDAAWRDAPSGEGAELGAVADDDGATRRGTGHDGVSGAPLRAPQLAALHRRRSAHRTGGARRTGQPVAANAAGPTRMSVVEALQELTVRRS